MYRFLQRNNKKLLAVFAAFLMIVFILPTTFDQMGGGQNPVLAKLGDGEELHAAELQAAEQDWQLLGNLRAGGGGGAFGGAYPLVYRLGPAAAGEIQNNPRLFILLQREAKRLGITVSADRVNDLITNELQGQTPNDRQSRERLYRAVEGLLLVEGGFHRAASVIKVSEPALKHALAQQTQNITVSLVEFPASNYAPATGPATAPAASAEQVKSQFDKYASLSPQVDPKNNPFGFGYRYPNRVKFQYLSIPRDAVKKAVEASKSDYEWEVEAQKYYLQNQSQFPTTKPAEPEEAPFSLTATRPATTQAAASAPTTRPFAEVRDDAKNRIVTPEVERRVNDIQNRVAAIIAADYLAYRNAVGSTSQPTTAAAPASSLGVPYNSYDYLQRLAQKIQAEQKVLPTVASFDDKLRGTDELKAIEHIGGTFGEDGDFPDYATSLAEPFVPSERQDDAAVLSLFEPSRPMRDNANNVYLFRLTAADPAHAPASPAEVADAINKDLAAAAAYERAKAEATKLLDAGKQSGLKAATASLSPIPPATQRSMLTVGPFPAEVRGALPGLDLKDDALAAFVRGAFELLSVAPPTRDGAKPLALIELPKQGKVYVAELADVTPRAQMAMFGDPKSEVEGRLRQELLQLFQMEWFNFENAKKRLGYASTEPERPREPATPASPRPPRPLL